MQIEARQGTQISYQSDIWEKAITDLFGATTERIFFS